MKDCTKEEIVLAHRYLYYVAMMPIISDSAYDKLERDALRTASDDSELHKVGSSLKESYSDKVKLIAYQLYEGII